MLPDNSLGDAGLEQISRAAMMLVTEHDEVDVALSCALQEDLGHVMLGRAQHFAMRVALTIAFGMQDGPLGRIGIGSVIGLLRRDTTSAPPAA
jgi:hypothetical protein